jgi:hypothetical protein
MFADDTFSLEAGSDLNDLILAVNNEINKMAVWFRANKLAVNITKTKYIIFRMKGKKINEDTLDVIYNENEPNVPDDPLLITTLERYHDSHPDTACRAYKLLGIYLDEHLTLDAHTNHVVNKLTRSLYCIKQAKHIIPPKGMQSLYFSLIHSHLTYCTSIMSGTTAKNRTKIIKIQKKAIRIMTNSSYNAHTNPLFKKHSILPYDLLIKQAQLTFMHAIEHKLAPSSFVGTWTKINERDPALNLRNADHYCLSQPRTETFKKSTFFALPAAWNALSPDIKYQPNKITFKWALRAHLLNELPEN